MKAWLAASLALVAVLVFVMYSRGEVDPRSDSTPANGLQPVGAAAIDPVEIGEHRAPAEPATAPGGLGAVDAQSSGSWAKLNDEAIAALEAGEFERAVALFERCLEAVPEEVVFARNLAEALSRLARHLLEQDAQALADAIATLERALELDPSRADLRALLDRWRAALETESEFWTDETAHFELSYDGERTELLRHGYTEITQLLEDVYDEYHGLLNHQPVGHGDPKIRVLLYKRDEFTRITGIGHWAGGSFDGTIRIPVADYARERSSFERVLRHELVHAFVRSYGGKDVPAWMNEGFAQWLESGSRALRVQSARAELAGKTLFPIGELQRSFSGMQDESAIALAYAQSFAFFDYLVQWYGDQLVFQMIRSNKDGRSCEETFRVRTAQELTSIASDFASEL